MLLRSFIFSTFPLHVFLSKWHCHIIYILSKQLYVQIFVATSHWVIDLVQGFWFLKYLKYRVIAEIYLGSLAVVQSQGDVVDGQGVPGRLCASCGVLHTSLPSCVAIVVGRPCSAMTRF